MTSGLRRAFSSDGARQADATSASIAMSYENYAVPPYYDSMLAKLIVTGPDRAAAMEVAKSALARFQVSGLETTVPFHARLLQRPEFARAEVHTRWVEENLADR